MRKCGDNENTTLTKAEKPHAPQAPSPGLCFVPAILYSPECVAGYFALIKSIWGGDVPHVNKEFAFLYFI